MAPTAANAAGHLQFTDIKWRAAENPKASVSCDQVVKFRAPANCQFGLGVETRFVSLGPPLQKVQATRQFGTLANQSKSSSLAFNTRRRHEHLPCFHFNLRALGKGLRKTHFTQCNAALSVAFPFATDADSWRVLIERLSVILAILVAHFSGAAGSSWRVGWSSNPPIGTDRNHSFGGSESSALRASAAEPIAGWGGSWDNQWGGATSAEQIAERRTSEDAASTSEPDEQNFPFPPRIWGDISDKLRAPPVGRRGLLVETRLAESPELSLQGLAREPRRLLLVAALGSIRETVESLPQECKNQVGEEWRGSSVQALVEAVRGAKNAWLDGAAGLPRGVGTNQHRTAKVVAQSSERALIEPAEEEQADSSWLQKLLGRKRRSQNVLDPEASEGAIGSQKGRESGRSGSAGESASEGERSSRGGFGGWAAPAVRMREDTNSDLDGSVPPELGLMGEKLPLYQELLYYLRFKTCKPGTRLPPGIFAKYSPRALEDLVLSVADAVTFDCMSQVGYSPQGIISSITQERYSPQSADSSSTQGEYGLQEAVSAQTRESYNPQKALSTQPQAGDTSEQGLEDGLAEQTQKMEQLMQRFLHPRLRSTRALERFRNEVSLRRLIRTKLASVASMYEDRYDLWGLQQQAIVGTSDSLEGPQPASAKNGRSAALGPLPGFPGFGFPRQKQAAPKAVEDWEVVVVGQRMPCRRIAELRKLEGWRLRYSMALEFADVAAPVLNALLAKLGDWISFLLVTMIGRSLGLIYKGIKQSLKRS